MDRTSLLKFTGDSRIKVALTNSKAKAGDPNPSIKLVNSMSKPEFS